MTGGRFRKQTEGFSSEQERIDFENSLVTQRDLRKLHAYLRPLIEDMMDRFEMQEVSQRACALNAMEDEINRAARLYLEYGKHENSRYPFSVYFTWYGKEVLGKLKKG